jgi:hypothetical protein
MLASRSTDTPRSLPSRSAAILTRCHWSRPWCPARLPSLRDSAHFTGLCSLRAASRVSASSAMTCSLEPNPPPTSGAMTRSSCSGIPVSNASMVRTMCGTWVADQRVNSFPDGAHTTALGSIGVGIIRWCR